MVDIKKDNKTIAADASEKEAQLSAAAPEKEKSKAEQKPDCPEISKGEKWYNRIVYQGLNYWANLIGSLVFADYFVNLSGRSKLDNVISKTTTAFQKTGLGAAKAARFAKITWETLALTSGGWVAAFITKPLEDNKRPIVHWLNRKMGVDQRAPDGHEETPDEIYIQKEQPHQSWLNVIGRRILASFLIIGTGHAIEHTVGKDNMTNFITTNTNKVLRSGYVPGGHTLADKGWFQRYLGFAALDTIFTGVHAATMRLTNGTKKAHLPKEIADNCDPEGHEEKGEIKLDKPLMKVKETPKEEKPVIETLEEKIAHKEHKENVPDIAAQDNKESLDKYKGKKATPSSNYKELAAKSADSSLSLAP